VEVNRIVRSGMPLVLICRDVDEAEAPIVRGDDFTGALALTRHLIEQGHRRIAFVGGRRLTSAGRERHAGYEAAHREASLPIDPALDISEAMTAAGGRDAAATLLALDPRPTAIFGFNDLVASGLIAALRRAGVLPGIEIAVAGYDDTEPAAWSTPALTSVFNVPDQIGALAADLLRRQIQGERVAPERILIRPELRVRESTFFPLMPETRRPF
jgi:DNA-binding LacI/PurR family transcriptional regulator